MGKFKRIVLISASAGAGAVAAAALILGGIVWYQSRPPEPWDTKAIQATYHGIDTVANLKVGQSDPMDRIRFYYIVRNTTHQDYRLDATSASMMGRLRDSRSLLHAPDANAFLSISYPLFIPAGRSVRLEVFLPTYGFQAEEPDRDSPHYLAHRKKLLEHMGTKMENLGGFVLLRYNKPR